MLSGLGRRVAGVVLGLSAVVSTVVGGRWLAFSVQDIGTLPASARSVGDDGLWLSHRWVDGRENEPEVEALAARLRTTGIRDLFVHVGPLGDDGTLDPRLRPQAAWFAGRVHGLLPGVRVLAWLGDEVRPGGRWAMEAFEGHDSWWSTAYLHQVAIRVDEVAVMSYDTALWSASAYSGFVRDETRLALAAVPSHVALLMGAPAFHTDDLGHLASAETVAAAIRGVRLALPAGAPRDRVFGVSLYMDYYATASDWAAYRSGWLPPNGAVAR